MNELELENNKSIFNNDVLSPEMKKYLIREKELS